MLGCSVTGLPAFNQARNRREHPGLATASAKVGAQGFLYVGFLGLRVTVQQAGYRNDEARCTKTALGSTFVEEGLLYIAEPDPIGETFYCHDLPVTKFDGRSNTAHRDLAINKYGTGTTLFFAASDFCASQAQLVTQHVSQGCIGIGINRPQSAVNFETDICHNVPARFFNRRNRICLP